MNDVRCNRAYLQLRSDIVWPGTLAQNNFDLLFSPRWPIDGGIGIAKINILREAQ